MKQLRRTIRRTYAALAAITLLLGGVGVVGHRALSGFVAQDAARRREIRAGRDLEKLLSSIREAESGQRGYLLTLDAAYLAPFLRAALESPDALARVAGSPGWPAADVEAIARDARAKLDELARTVRLASAGRRDEALAIVREGSGRRLMAALRDRADRMAARLDSDSEAREADLERSAAAALVAFPVAGTLSAAAVFGMFALAVRQAIARTRADARDRDSRDESARNVALLNALSHDIRTPLNAIALSAKLAAMLARFRDVDGDRLVACMADIEANAGTIAVMAEEFLETSRAEHGRPDPTTFRLRPLLDDLAAPHAAEVHARGIALEVDCGVDVEARTDRRLLRRIAANLLGNAVKFTTRGSVAVRAARRDGLGVVLEVRDTGPGIAASDLPKLFRDFVQLGNGERDSAKGFGLGLSNSLRLAKHLGGTIDVESTPGRGSTFTVTLPDLAPPP